MPKKIYLIEDDVAIIDIYETMLKKAHFDVLVLSLGQQVMEKIKEIITGQEAKPDLVLLDLILPDMNGMDILTEMKKNIAAKDIVVFILSNQADAESQMAGAVKPDKFIVKANVTPTELLEIIKKQLK